MIRMPARLDSWPNNVLSFAASMLQEDDATVICDASALKWTMPIGLCGLVAACAKLQERGQEVRFVNLTDNMGNYFARMDVFRHCGMDAPSIRRTNLADSLVELRCVRSAQEVSVVANALVNAITGQMMMGQDDGEDPDGMRARPSERLAQPLQHVMSELLENAVTHAQAKGYRGAAVWVCANYFAKLGEVRIGIVDTGCGFLRSLESHERVRKRATDDFAIAMALEPYVSCNKAVGILDDSSNQGIGLTVSAEVAQRSDGWLEVNSGSASVRAWPRRVLLGHLSWQGAALDVSMKRNQLLSLDLPTLIRPFQREPRPRLRFE